MPAATVATNSAISNRPRSGEGSSDVAGQTEFISFAIGNEQYGVNIMTVREIKEWSNITNLPNQPEYVRGILNLRGVMVPIVDLRCRFGQGRPKRRQRTS